MIHGLGYWLVSDEELLAVIGLVLLIGIVIGYALRSWHEPADATTRRAPTPGRDDAIIAIVCVGLIAFVLGFFWWGGFL